jgi:signal transduction histidine kinase
MGAALSIVVARAYATEQEGRVLILNGLDPYLPAYLAMDSGMRGRLATDTTKRILYFSESLDTQRFSMLDLEPDYVSLMTRKYSGLHIDVVVAIGQLAIEFFARHGEQLWPGARVVFEDSYAVYAGPVVRPPTAADALHYSSEAETIAIARQLQPKARRIVVVSGTADLDRSAEQLARTALSTGTERLPEEFLTGLPLDELLVRVAAEPADSIVIYLSQFRDREGRPYMPREVLRALGGISKAPLYGTSETFLGFGMAAGSVESFEDKGRLMADRVLEALLGRPSDPKRAYPKSICIADAHALKRWSLDERRLPTGCEIHFADPSFWRRYGWQSALVLAILAGQTALIVALFAQHRRRRIAEAESRKRFAELAHINRRVSMEEFSASIVHELKQPLASIHLNASAAKTLVRAEPANLEKMAEILDDIKSDDQRAIDVLDRVGDMVRKTEFEVRNTDLNEAIEQIMKVLAGEASVRGVLVKSELEPGLSKVSVDSVLLKQVILNLALNAMEAMHDQPADKRVMTIRSRRANVREAGVSVADSGAGIAQESIGGIFDPFVTTKPGGMGMGLAISRTIVEAYGGRIHAENAPTGGAVFYFTLPFASCADQTNHHPAG